MEAISWSLNFLNICRPSTSPNDGNTFQSFIPRYRIVVHRTSCRLACSSLKHSQLKMFKDLLPLLAEFTQTERSPSPTETLFTYVSSLNSSHGHILCLTCTTSSLHVHLLCVHLLACAVDSFEFLYAQCRWWVHCYAFNHVNPLSLN